MRSVATIDASAISRSGKVILKSRENEGDSSPRATSEPATPPAVVPCDADKPARRWDAEEIAWGRECLASGDSVEEIAETAGCAVAEVVANIGPGRLTAQQREVVSLYVAGLSFAEIDAQRGHTTGRPGSAAAAMITGLRQRGVAIPYRHGWRRFA